MIIRRLFAVLLCVILGLSSGTMAVARGQGAGATAITICSGYGVVTLYLGPDGTPVPGEGGVHLCPDCLAGLGLGVLPTAPSVFRPTTRSHSVAVPTLAWPALRKIAVPKARGPPFLV